MPQGKAFIGQRPNTTEQVLGNPNPAKLGPDAYHMSYKTLSRGYIADYICRGVL